MPLPVPPPATVSDVVAFYHGNYPNQLLLGTVQAVYNADATLVVDATVLCTGPSASTRTKSPRSSAGERQQGIHAERLDPHAAPPLDEPVLPADDLQELQERREQLQQDVRVSQTRVDEIRAFLRDAAGPPPPRTAEEDEDGDDPTASAEEHTASAAAKKSLTKARAMLRGVKAEDWASFRLQYHPAAPLKAVVEAAACLLGDRACRTYDQALKRKDLPQRLGQLKFPHVKAKDAEAAGKLLSPHSRGKVAPTHKTAGPLYDWTQAMLRCVQVRRQRRAAAKAVTLVQPLQQPLTARTESSRASSARRKGGGDDGPASPSSDCADLAATSRPSEANSAELQRLRDELQEHEEYVELAKEELQALNELITEAGAATTQAGTAPRAFRVPFASVACVLPPSCAASVEGAHVVPVGATVSLPVAAVEILRGAMEQIVVSTTTRDNRSPTSRSRRSSTGSVKSSPHTPRRREGSGQTQTPHTPPSRRSSAPQFALPDIPDLRLPSRGVGEETASATPSGTPEHNEASNSSLRNQSVRARYERVLDSPRLATPRVGPTLAPSATPKSLRRSQEGTPQSETAQSPKAPADAVASGGGGGAGTPHGAVEPVSRVLLARPESSPRATAAAHSSSLLSQDQRDTEVQLLNEELRACKADLKRVIDERDRLVAERRDRPRFTVGRPSITANDFSAAGLQGASTPRDTVDHAIVEELEEQLNAAHQRIKELEAARAEEASAPPTVTSRITVGTAPQNALEESMSHSQSPLPGPADGADSHTNDSSHTDDRRSFSSHHLPHTVLMNSSPGAQAIYNQEAVEQLQAQVTSLRSQLESQTRATSVAEERLNQALHEREEAKQHVASMTGELATVWTRLEETEQRLQDEQDRARLEMSRPRAYSVEPSVPMPILDSPALLGGGEDTSTGVMSPKRSVSAALRSESGVPPASGSVSGANNRAYEWASRASSVVPYGTRDNGESRASSMMPATKGNPVEAMSVNELRHEVRLLRQEVERYQASELKLAMELQSMKERQGEERRRRKEARTVRLQMLNRLQDAVQEALVKQSEELGAIPELLQRSKEETEAVLSQYQRHR